MVIKFKQQLRCKHRKVIPKVELLWHSTGLIPVVLAFVVALFVDRKTTLLLVLRWIKVGQQDRDNISSLLWFLWLVMGKRTQRGNGKQRSFGNLVSHRLWLNLTIPEHMHRVVGVQSHPTGRGVVVGQKMSPMVIRLLVGDSICGRNGRRESFVYGGNGIGNWELDGIFNQSWLLFGSHRLAKLNWR